MENQDFDTTPLSEPTQANPVSSPPMEAHRAFLVLILGIIGLLWCGIFSVLAWIFGNEDLAKMAAGTMDPSGENTTKAGRILGIIGVIWMSLGILVFLVYIMFGLGFLVGVVSHGF